MSITVSIGVLSLQGSVEEHLRLLSACEGVQSFPVKSADALNRVDGLILPGGFQLSAPLLGRIRQGLPVWGTCAGLILLAKQLVGEPSHLGVMDITVRRNAYGRQINSFSVTDSIPPVADHPLSLTFIRAPWIEEAGRGVQVLHTLRGKITAAREDRLLATTFHPELTADPAFHRYFTGIVRGSLPV